jgi:hypothetical protein
MTMGATKPIDDVDRKLMGLMSEGVCTAHFLAIMAELPRPEVSRRLQRLRRRRLVDNHPWAMGWNLTEEAL